MKMNMHGVLQSPTWHAMDTVSLSNTKPGDHDTSNFTTLDLLYLIG